MKQSGSARSYGWLLVGAQFALIAYLLLLMWQSGIPDALMQLVPALILIADGLTLFILTMLANRPGNWSVHPLPRDGAQFVTSGPYRWIRHPMYAAVILVAAGAALWTFDGSALLAATALLVVLIEKIRLEEQSMAGVFTGWDAFTARTARLIPMIW